MLNKVTIIIVSYNHKEYVQEAILSVLNQTYKNIQIIVADDNSTDGSIELIEKLASEHSFLFIQNKKNIGLNNNILAALEEVKGEYISFLASDDYMDPNKTETLIQYLLKNGKDGVYATGYSLNGKKKKLIKISKVFQQKNPIKILNFLYTQDWECPLLQSALFRINVLKELISLREEYKSDDWAFLIKAYELYNIDYINEPLFYYRLHENNTHRNYWFTYPMRIDIASRLIPVKFRKKCIANINLSQGNYLMADKQFFFAISFYANSLLLSFNIKTIISIIKTIGVFFRDFNKE